MILVDIFDPGFISSFFTKVTDDSIYVFGLQAINAVFSFIYAILLPTRWDTANDTVLLALSPSAVIFLIISVYLFYKLISSSLRGNLDTFTYQNARNPLIMAVFIYMALFLTILPSKVIIVTLGDHTNDEVVVLPLTQNFLNSNNSTTLDAMPRFISIPIGLTSRFLYGIPNLDPNTSPIPSTYPRDTPNLGFHVGDLFDLKIDDGSPYLHKAQSQDVKNAREYIYMIKESMKGNCASGIIQNQLSFPCTTTSGNTTPVIVQPAITKKLQAAFTAEAFAKQSQYDLTTSGMIIRSPLTVSDYEYSRNHPLFQIVLGNTYTVDGDTKTPSIAPHLIATEFKDDSNTTDFPELFAVTKASLYSKNLINEEYGAITDSPSNIFQIKYPNPGIDELSTIVPNPDCTNFLHPSTGALTITSGISSLDDYVKIYEKSCTIPETFRSNIESTYRQKLETFIGQLPTMIPTLPTEKTNIQDLSDTLDDLIINTNPHLSSFINNNFFLKFENDSAGDTEGGKQIACGESSFCTTNPTPVPLSSKISALNIALTDIPNFFARLAYLGEINSDTTDKNTLNNAFTNLNTTSHRIDFTTTIDWGGDDNNPAVEVDYRVAPSNLATLTTLELTQQAVAKKSYIYSTQRIDVNHNITKILTKSLHHLIISNYVYLKTKDIKSSADVATIFGPTLTEISTTNTFSLTPPTSTTPTPTSLLSLISPTQQQLTLTDVFENLIQREQGFSTVTGNNGLEIAANFIFESSIDFISRPHDDSATALPTENQKLKPAMLASITGAYSNFINQDDLILKAINREVLLEKIALTMGVGISPIGSQGSSTYRAQKAKTLEFSPNLSGATPIRALQPFINVALLTDLDLVRYAAFMLADKNNITQSKKINGLDKLDELKDSFKKIMGYESDEDVVKFAKRIGAFSMSFTNSIQFFTGIGSDNEDKSLLGILLWIIVETIYDGGLFGSGLNTIFDPLTDLTANLIYFIDTGSISSFTPSKVVTQDYSVTTTYSDNESDILLAAYISSKISPTSKIPKTDAMVINTFLQPYTNNVDFLERGVEESKLLQTDRTKNYFEAIKGSYNGTWEMIGNFFTGESNPEQVEKYTKNAVIISTFYLQPLYAKYHQASVKFYQDQVVSDGVDLQSLVYDRWLNKAGDYALIGFDIITWLPILAPLKVIKGAALGAVAVTSKVIGKKLSLPKLKATAKDLFKKKFPKTKKKPPSKFKKVLKSTAKIALIYLLAAPGKIFKAFIKISFLLLLIELLVIIYCFGLVIGLLRMLLTSLIKPMVTSLIDATKGMAITVKQILTNNDIDLENVFTDLFEKYLLKNSITIFMSFLALSLFILIFEMIQTTMLFYVFQPSYSFLSGIGHISSYNFLMAITISLSVLISKLIFEVVSNLLIVDKRVIGDDRV
jgi:hypothetical protein